MPDKKLASLYNQAVNHLLTGLIREKTFIATLAPDAYEDVFSALALTQAGYADVVNAWLHKLVEQKFENEHPLLSLITWLAVEQASLSGNIKLINNLYPAIEQRARQAETVLEALISAGEDRLLSPDPISHLLTYSAKNGSNQGPGRLWSELVAIQSAGEAARLLGKFEEAVNFQKTLDRCLNRIIPQNRYLASAMDVSSPPVIILARLFHHSVITERDQPQSPDLTITTNHSPASSNMVVTAVTNEDNVFSEKSINNDFDPAGLLLMVNAHLARGEQDAAIRMFESFIQHPSVSSIFEVRETSRNTVPSPNMLFSLFIITLRNMLVLEDSQNLHLFSFIPSSWLQRGHNIYVENLPTKFGLLSLEARATDKEIIVAFRRPTRIDPERIFIHLPPEFEVKKVSRCGQSMRMWGARDVFITGFRLNEVTEIKLTVSKAGPSRSSPGKIG